MGASIHLTRRGVLLGIGITVWAATVAFGMAALWRSKSIPAPLGIAATRWPVEVGLTRATDRPTLVMFAHPHCPCTRASISELARLSAKLADRVRSYVTFVRPDGMSDAWVETDLWRSAAAIPGVTVHRDDGGVLTARFGSLTSGTVLLYGPAGDLWFSGGLTSARGHEGGTHAQDTIVELVHGRGAAGASAPVFGCHLGTTPLARQ